MAARNHVTPMAEIVAIPLRGAWTGNRGILHRGREIGAPSSVCRTASASGFGDKSAEHLLVGIRDHDGHAIAGFFSAGMDCLRVD
jgi:hypothetical protein